MREILFRGQTRRYGEKVRIGDGQKLPGRWVYGGVLQGVGVHSIIYGGENQNDPSVGLNKWVVYTDTLGQFTGMTDKNGKKIFEGDIVTFPFDEFNPCAKFKIEWVGAEFCAVHIEGKPCVWTIRVTDYADQMDIIGNIHDNPELLEVLCVE